MATAEMTVLAAFNKQPRMCIHKVMDATGWTRDYAKIVLNGLVKEGTLRRTSVGKADYVYHRTQREAVVDPDLGLDKGHVPLLLGLTESEARARVSMLHHMKTRLIKDWHPIIDKLIADYERGLQSVESIRYGADDELHSSEKEVENG